MNKGFDADWKKYTLASRFKPAHKPKLAREYFFSNPKKLKNKKSPILQRNKTSFQRTVLTPTDIALNVNRLEQTWCELQTVVLRPNSGTAGNIRLKEMIKSSQSNMKIGQIQTRGKADTQASVQIKICIRL